MVPQVFSDDNTIPPDYPLIKFYSMVKPVLREKYGFDIRVLDTLPAILENIGFINVHRKVFHMPLGEWARDSHLRLLGGYFREVVVGFVGAMAARPLVEAGFERDEISDVVKAVTEAAGNRRVHAYLPIHFVWAQKPPT